MVFIPCASAGAQDALPPSRAVLSQLPSGIVWLRAPVAPPRSGEMVTLVALEQPRTYRHQGWG